MFCLKSKMPHPYKVGEETMIDKFTVYTNFFKDRHGILVLSYN